MGTSFRSLLLLGLGLTAGLASAQTPSCEKTEKIDDDIHYGFKITGLDENSPVSGTKVEFQIQPQFYFTVPPGRNNISLVHIFVKNITIKLGDETIKTVASHLDYVNYNDGHGIDMYNVLPQWKYRFSSLKWPHNTPVPISYEAAYHFDLSDGMAGRSWSEEHSFSNALTLSTYNKLWVSAQGGSGTGFLNEAFAQASSSFYSRVAGGSSFPHHDRQPTSLAAATAHTKSDIRDNVMSGTVYWFMLHGAPTFINPPSNQNLTITLPHTGSASIESARLMKGAIPPLTVAAGFCCETLAGGSDAEAGWGTGGANRFYFGFESPVAALAMTSLAWLNYTVHDQNHTTPPLYDMDSDMGAIAGHLADLMTVTDLRAGEALQDTNESYAAIGIDNRYSPYKYAKISLTYSANSDLLATLKFVYLEQDLIYNLKALNKPTTIYWIELS